MKKKGLKHKVCRLWMWTNFPECVFKLRCLIWEGEWRADVATVAAERGRRGVYGKIVLAVCGAVRWFSRHLTRQTLTLNLIGCCWLFKMTECWAHSTVQYGIFFFFPSGDWPQDTSVFSSTPLVQRKCLFQEQHNTTDLCSTMSQNPDDDTVRRQWGFK